MSDDDNYEIPLQDQRVFGAGIKRQRVKFVPSSSSSSSSITLAQASEPAKSVSEIYLSLVLPKEVPSLETNVQSSLPSPTPLAFADNGLSAIETTDPQVCEVCRLPYSMNDDTVVLESNDLLSQSAEPQPRPTPPKRRPHEASLAHQVCLKHSHPPSHLDRSRKGLEYLSAYGWDLDSRKGLGAEGQGIQFPIKTKAKDDKLGIGVVLPQPGEIKKKEKSQKLDAGKIRKLQERDRKKGEKLRDLFYRSEDVERYLAGG